MAETNAASIAEDKPLVLVSNDDGFQAAGIRTLADHLRKDYDVWVVAPERDRSATSHSLSLYKPLRMREEAHQVYAVSGQPVDCVYLALCHILPKPPALVVSGINAGPNVGSDTLYSGTVAAAMEGALHGYTALAMSLNASPGTDASAFEPGAALARQLCARLLEVGLPRRHILSVNLPLSYQVQDPVFWSELCMDDAWTHSVDVRTDPRGDTYAWIGGYRVDAAPTPGTDSALVAEGKAAAALLSANLSAGVLEAEGAHEAFAGVIR